MRRFNRPYPEYRVNSYAPPTTVPMSEINTTPLIDVLLVLLIMIILTVPSMTHNVLVDLPAPPDDTVIYETPAPQIGLTISAAGQINWQGEPISRDQLSARLQETAVQRPDTVIRFEPDPMTSYDNAVQVINLVDDAGIGHFAFVGNHRFETFDRGD